MYLCAAKLSDPFGLGVTRDLLPERSAPLHKREEPSFLARSQPIPSVLCDDVRAKALHRSPHVIRRALAQAQSLASRQQAPHKAIEVRVGDAEVLVDVDHLHLPPAIRMQALPQHLFPKLRLEHHDLWPRPCEKNTDQRLFADVLVPTPGSKHDLARTTTWPPPKLA